MASQGMGAHSGRWLWFGKNGEYRSFPKEV